MLRVTLTVSSGSIVCACRRGYASVLDGQCVRCRGFELRGFKNLMFVLSKLPAEYKWPTINYKELCRRVAVAHVTNQRGVTCKTHFGIN